MKFFSMLPMLGRSLFDLTETAEDDTDWRRDPLAHPVLEGMSMRELADLPFNRCYRLLQDAPRAASH